MAADPLIDILLVVPDNADRSGEALLEGISEICGPTNICCQLVGWQSSTTAVAYDAPHPDLCRAAAGELRDQAVGGLQTAPARPLNVLKCLRASPLAVRRLIGSEPCTNC